MEVENNFKIQEKNMIKGRLEKILSTYNDNPKKVSNEIVYGCPKALIQLANIPDRFKVYGRWRTGNTAQVPWVGVFDRDITDSAQRGYYIAYLFNAKMQGVYLSLNQGWTDFQKQYKTKKGKVIFSGNKEALGVKQNVVDMPKKEPEKKDNLDDILS